MSAPVATYINALHWLPVKHLPPASAALQNREYLHESGVKYRCNGTAWIIMDGSGAGGALDPNSPIIGLPSEIDTLGEIAALAQTANTRLQALDNNNNNRADLVDALELHTPILGAPPTLDTLAKLITAVQTLFADVMMRSIYDANNDAIVDSVDGGMF